MDSKLQAAFATPRTGANFDWQFRLAGVVAAQPVSVRGIHEKMCPSPHPSDLPQLRLELVGSAPVVLYFECWTVAGYANFRVSEISELMDRDERVCSVKLRSCVVRKSF